VLEESVEKADINEDTGDAWGLDNLSSTIEKAVEELRKGGSSSSSTLRSSRPPKIS
jgi:hypothetical protein